MPASKPTTANMTAMGFSERDLSRFLAKVDTSGPCWVWTGGTNGVGYGQFHWGSRYHGKRTHYAHRLAYELWVGPIPPTLSIDHSCNRGNAGCITPDHLRAMPIRDNVMRSPINILAMKAAQTMCIHGHPLSGDNVKITQRGRRRCLACAKGHSSWLRDPVAASRRQRERYFAAKGITELPPKRPRRTNVPD